MPKPFVLIPIITPRHSGLHTPLVLPSYIIAGYLIYDLAVCHDRSLRTINIELKTDKEGQGQILLEKLRPCLM